MDHEHSLHICAACRLSFRSQCPSILRNICPLGCLLPFAPLRSAPATATASDPAGRIVPCRGSHREHRQPLLCFEQANTELEPASGQGMHAHTQGHTQEHTMRLKRHQLAFD